MYQSTVNLIDSLKLSLGAQFNSFFALLLLSINKVDSLNFLFLVIIIFFLSPHVSIIAVTTSNTVLQFEMLGPKFQLGLIKFDIFLLINKFPKIKYPEIGSKTCCQGLVALGLRIISCDFFAKDLIVSGTILFFFMSPPPITFPALVEPQISFFLFTPR